MVVRRHAGQKDTGTGMDVVDAQPVRDLSTRKKRDRIAGGIHPIILSHRRIRIRTCLEPRQSFDEGPVPDARRSEYVRRYGRFRESDLPWHGSGRNGRLGLGLGLGREGDGSMRIFGQERPDVSDGQCRERRSERVSGEPKAIAGTGSIGETLEKRRPDGGIGLQETGVCHERFAWTYGSRCFPSADSVHPAMVPIHVRADSEICAIDHILPQLNVRQQIQIRGQPRPPKGDDESGGAFALAVAFVLAFNFDSPDIELSGSSFVDGEGHPFESRFLHFLTDTVGNPGWIAFRKHEPEGSRLDGVDVSHFPRRFVSFLPLGTVWRNRSNYGHAKVIDARFHAGQGCRATAIVGRIFVGHGGKAGHQPGFEQVESVGGGGGVQGRCFFGMFRRGRCHLHGLLGIVLGGSS
mmetsp:Transcript_11632/g.22566  ORF Transcript_11632/g.22566 Transcript_11632/m.22566 type:complete len:408 (-) Transcript_11632:4-1227(-)